MIHKHSIHLLVLITLLVCGVAVLGAQSPRTVLAGVYTETQAERGEMTYSRYCSRCHGGDLDGIGAAPALHGAQFIDRWREDSLSGIFDYIKANMPLDAKPKPGGLMDEQYLDITAYLLFENEYPTGMKELLSSDLDATLLVDLDGPKPLPSSAMVRVVGCLAQSGGNWTLSRASVPSRVRKGDTTDAAELAKSAGTAIGTQEYRLPNLADDHKASDLLPLVAKKVQVKGVLNAQVPTPRISVLSFEPLGQDCPK